MHLSCSDRTGAALRPSGATRICEPSVPDRLLSAGEEPPAIAPRLSTRPRPTYICDICNDYEQHVSWADYCKTMQDLALQVARHQGANDLPRIDDIRINDIGPVMCAAGDEIELVPMSFSFPPGRSGGAPVSP
jgi:hypothetical protein